MHWVTFLDNPKAVSSLFGDACDLSSVEIHEVALGREGSVLRLRFDVPVVPSCMPSKWPAGSNTTQITIAAWGIESLEIAGWTSQVSGEFTVSRLGDLLALSLPVRATTSRLHSATYV
ncbi:hypothetical protein DN824_05870 [Stutzerimonas nosocomialis]|uniref:Imm50 family immunity protein n=1 Tax=Stutzerimonas nosocomialis TaxID=1056496 RepID=UPI00110877F9|nr:hypothetical protein DN824_05870 [Stutzerimonas nosocomialis]